MSVNRWEWWRSRARLFLQVLMGDWHDLSITASVSVSLVTNPLSVSLATIAAPIAADSKGHMICKHGGHASFS